MGDTIAVAAGYQRVSREVRGVLARRGLASIVEVADPGFVIGE